MDEKELLALLYEAELDRLEYLSDSAFIKEAKAWFNRSISQYKTRESLQKAYMRDYMRWQSEASIEELENEVFNELQLARREDLRKNDERTIEQEEDIDR